MKRPSILAGLETANVGEYTLNETMRLWKVEKILEVKYVMQKMGQGLEQMAMSFYLDLMRFVSLRSLLKAASLPNHRGHCSALAHGMQLHESWCEP